MAETIKYESDYAIHPGEILSDYLENYNIVQKDFSNRLDCSLKHLNSIINGKASISPEMAFKLDNVTGINATFWNNLQSNYELDLARIRLINESKNHQEEIKKFPIKEMKKYNFIPNVNELSEVLRELYRFFACNNINELFKIKEYKCLTKIDKQYQPNKYAIVSWFRQAELKSEKKKNVNNFSKEKLLTVISEIKQLTMIIQPEDFMPKLEKILWDCGVIIILVPDLPKTCLFGAVFKNKYNNIVLALSLRKKTNDFFWFSLFHELAHLLLHSLDEVILEFNKKDDIRENEADKKASELLIDKDKLDYLIELLNSKKIIEEELIVNFSVKYQIHPAIVLGQLQHKNIIPYKTLLNKFKIAYQWK